MKESFEKIKERLKEADKYHDRIINLGDALHIVSEVEAEYGNGWIPCSGCKDCEHKECEHHGKV